MRLNTVQRTIIVIAIVSLVVLALFPPFIGGGRKFLGHFSIKAAPKHLHSDARVYRTQWVATGGIIIIGAVGLFWAFKDRG